MWYILAILAVPLIEIGLFVQIGGAIGLWLTLAWVIASAALGIIVLKGVSMIGPVSLSLDMRELNDPNSLLAHRVMLVLAGGFLLIPGFLTDTIGLLLLVPPIRLAAIKLLGRKFRAANNVSVHGTVIEGEWQVKDTQQGNPPSDPTRH